MSFQNYLCLAGEIVNHGRLQQMVGIGMGPEGIMCNDFGWCPDLDAGLGFPGGYNPTENPWFDPNEPASGDFAGLYVTGITGLEPGAYARPIVERAGIGAVLGQGRQVAPQIVVTALLFARTCEGMDYGYRWLRAALRGSCVPGQVCTGDDLIFLDTIPEFPDLDCGPVDYETFLAPYFRRFKGAALVDGPKISSIVARGCPSCYSCGIYEVQFTLSASDPCMYSTPTTLIDSMPFLCSAATGDCIEWVTDPTDGCDDDTCEAAAPCSTDPDCVDVSPPAMPTILNNCVVDCINADECSVVIDVDAATFPVTAEGTLIVTVYAGAEAMRSVEISVWNNPLQLNIDDLDTCDRCSVLTVGYVAPGATLVVDGQDRTANIQCVGGSTVRANPFIAGSTGTASFSYPQLLGGNYYTVQVQARGPVGGDASVTIEAVSRFC